MTREKPTPIETIGLGQCHWMQWQIALTSSYLLSAVPAGFICLFCYMQGQIKRSQSDPTPLKEKLRTYVSKHIEVVCCICVLE